MKATAFIGTVIISYTSTKKMRDMFVCSDAPSTVERSTIHDASSSPSSSSSSSSASLSFVLEFARRTSNGWLVYGSRRLPPTAASLQALR